MPCNDVTELIEVSLGPDNRLKSYSLRKICCGQTIGPESLLVDYLRDKTIPEILELDPHTLHLDSPPHSDIEKFLRQKHLVALKLTLEAFSGTQPGGGKDAVCQIARINYGNDGVEIEAEIPVAIVTKMIKACGFCGKDIEL
jgi:hypothetical protein